MTRIYRVLILVLLISSDVKGQVPAETIPEFTFLKSDQTVFSTKNLTPGKKFFFIFFDTECDHCRHAISYLNEHLAAFKTASIYLITLSGRDKANLFMAAYGNKLISDKKITILQDFKNEFITKFKPRKYPSIYLYSTQKKLILYDDNEQNMPLFLKRVTEKNKK